MTPRTALKLAAVGLAVLAFATKAWWSPGSTEAKTTVSTQGVPIVQRAGERGFTLGSLAFTPCELDQRNSAATTAAFCAPFKVPENRDHPDGRQIDLKLALIRGAQQPTARDLVVLLAGGPGQAAVEAWPRAAAGFGPLLEHHNVLLLDQRGTGGSNALVCKDDPSDVDAAAVREIDLDKVRTQTRVCLDEVSKTADPAQYTTTVAVEDLEAVRQALGAPTFDLVGVSYGTRVAQQFLRRYPDGVRSVVLDSAVPNEQILGSDFSVALDAALKAQFADCTRTPACAKALGDPYANLYRLRDALAANPPTVAYRDPRSQEQKSRPLDVYTFATIVRMFAYSTETSALLPLGIERALKGDYAPLLGQADLLTADLADLAGNGMQLSVVCAEDADALTDRPQDAPLILGDTLVRVMRAQCGVWPHGKKPADFHAPVASDKPVLILSGEYDPVTPPRYAEQIVKGLPNGRVLVAKGQGHSVMARGCFPKLVKTFVETLDAAKLDAGCVADFGATPAFTTYNGAAP
ncbi:MAG: alpha/beta hydrolase [Dokdonella sp.]|uniref:alpha/beta hydrolase n=1 Tax=Dokdonella sp. TaxID=2291710 RepID=UPI00326481C7